MSINSLRVSLLAPGCFSMVAQGDELDSAEKSAPVDLNDSTAVLTGTQTYEQALSAVLKQPIPLIGEIPVAAHQFPIDMGISLPAHCVCAELIHLQADKDNARLVPESALNISDEEASQLLGSLNDLIRSDGLEVVRSVGGRNYLTGMPATGLDVWPAHAVANGKIANSLPRLAEAGDWRRFLTEVQMLFHAHPVNAARAQLQQLPINGMWFWGGSPALPQASVEKMVLVADDLYAQGYGSTVGLAALTSVSSTWADLAQRYVADPDIEDIVIVDLCAYEAWLGGDHSALSAAKKDLGEQWIAPIQKAVTAGLVSEFVLDGCEGQGIIERQAKRSNAFKSTFDKIEKMIPKRLFGSTEK